MHFLIRVYRIDIVQELEHGHGGLDLALPAKQNEGGKVVHGGRRKLQKHQPAVTDHVLQELRKQQLQTSISIGYVDGNLAGRWMRGELVPNHLESRGDLVGVHLQQ